MKLTVQTAVSDRPVHPEAIEPWVNKEARVVLAKLREAANFTGRERSEVTTAGDAADTVVWESEALPQDCTWAIRAWVVGAPLASTSGYGDFCQHCTVTSRDGVIAGVQFVRWANTDAGLADPSFNIDTVERKVNVTVQDDATSWRFVAVVEVLEALSP